MPPMCSNSGLSFSPACPSHSTGVHLRVRSSVFNPVAYVFEIWPLFCCALFLSLHWCPPPCPKLGVQSCGLCVRNLASVFLRPFPLTPPVSTSVSEARCSILSPMCSKFGLCFPWGFPSHSIGVHLRVRSSVLNPVAYVFEIWPLFSCAFFLSLHWCPPPCPKLGAQSCRLCVGLCFSPAFSSHSIGVHLCV